MKKLIEGKELKSVILNTLLRFDEFCKERDIKYTIAYGTALGAIRHKGFIPFFKMSLKMLNPLPIKSNIHKQLSLFIFFNRNMI